jgi:hypothetical protein
MVGSPNDEAKLVEEPERGVVAGVHHCREAADSEVGCCRGEQR